MPIFCSQKWIKNKLFSLTFFLFFWPKNLDFWPKHDIFSKEPCIRSKAEPPARFVDYSNLDCWNHLHTCPSWATKSSNSDSNSDCSRGATHKQAVWTPCRIVSAIPFQAALSCNLETRYARKYRHFGIPHKKHLLSDQPYSRNPILETLFSKPYFQTHISKTFLFSKSTLY